jgi:hypothetical protein
VANLYLYVIRSVRHKKTARNSQQGWITCCYSNLLPLGWHPPHTTLWLFENAGLSSAFVMLWSLDWSLVTNNNPCRRKMAVETVTVETSRWSAVWFITQSQYICKAIATACVTCAIKGHVFNAVVAWTVPVIFSHYRSLSPLSLSRRKDYN